MFGECLEVSDNRAFREEKPVAWLWRNAKRELAMWTDARWKGSQSYHGGSSRAALLEPQARRLAKQQHVRTYVRGKRHEVTPRGLLWETRAGVQAT